MDENGSVEFQRCFTCGKWHPTAGAYSERYCSRICAKAFGKCPVCGEYFEVSSGSGVFCSGECAGVDGRDMPEELAEVSSESPIPANDTE